MQETPSGFFKFTCKYCFQLVTQNSHLKDYSSSFKEFGDLSMPYDTYDEALIASKDKVKEMLEFDSYEGLEFYSIIKKIHKI